MLPEEKEERRPLQFSSWQPSHGCGLPFGTTGLPFNNVAASSYSPTCPSGGGGGSIQLAAWMAQTTANSAIHGGRTVSMVLWQ